MNQNKGIGAYQNRPGYFMGGMIGGAILGALVNKIQGKDWKRGAIWGGIGGGLGSWAGKALMPAAGTSPGKLSFLQKMLYQGAPGAAGGPTQYALRPALAAFGGAGLGAVAGGAGAYMAGDPEYDKKKMEEAMLAENEERKRKNIEMYPDWYKNFFPGFFKNEGGMINERPGYYNGGSATLEYTDPDLYTPTGEGGGPSSNPIMQLPLGPEGSFTDEFDELDMTELNDQERGELQSLMTIRLMTPKDDPKYEQIEIRIQELLGRMDTAMSEPHPDEGSYDMFFDEFGRYPKDPEELRLFLDELDLDVPAVAQGGLMSRPGYMDGGMENSSGMTLASGGKEPWQIRAEIDDLNNALSETSDPRQRQIIEIKINTLLSELGYDRAAQGGLMRLHAKDGLWANIHAKRKRIAGGSGETMRSAGSAGAPTDEALRQSQAGGGYMERPGYSGGGMTDEEKIAYQGLIDSGYTEDEAVKIIELHGSDYSGLQVPSYLKSQALGNARGGYKMRPKYMSGGIGDMDLTQGGASFGAGTGTSDDIPAMLSDGEFVVTANAVKNLGGGNRMLGAKKMYQMMNQLDPNSQTPAEMDTTGIA